MNRAAALVAASILTSLASLWGVWRVDAQSEAAALKAKATFINIEGQSIGTALLTETPNGVLIQIDVSGLPPGEHAFHIHEVGLCEPGKAFESAGGHLAVGHKHGYLVPDGPHPGDMPNQFVSSAGVLHAHVFNPAVTLGTGDNTLFGTNGTALVLHTGVDDYHSQPAGNAGGRIACAVIEKS